MPRPRRQYGGSSGDETMSAKVAAQKTEIAETLHLPNAIEKQVARSQARAKSALARLGNVVLDEQLIDDARSLIGLAINLDTLCDFMGISMATYYLWLDMAQRDPGSMYGEFATIVKQARAGAEIGLLHDIRRGVPSWQSRAWLLERGWRDHWSAHATTSQDQAEFERKAQLIADELQIPVGDVVRAAQDIARSREAELDAT